MSSSFSLVRHAAFFDEFVKISAAKSPNNKNDALKRKVLAVGVQALGAGLGFATASALHDIAMKNPSKLWLNMSPERRNQILGGLKMLSAMGGQHAATKVLEYRAKVEKK
jgi:hypothetical protein